VRVLGVFFFLLAGAGVGLCIRGMFRASRPADLGFAVAAPIAVIAAVVGLALAFVPGAL